MHNFAYLQYSYPRKQSKGYKECILLYFGNVGHPPPREVARLSKMCISSLENSAPYFRVTLDDSFAIGDDDAF